jgi:hypothetical protein
MGNSSMADRGDYEELANQCIRQAQETAAPEMRAFLLMMAQAWLRLGRSAEQAQSLVNKIDGEQME